MKTNNNSGRPGIDFTDLLRRMGYQRDISLERAMQERWEAAQAIKQLRAILWRAHEGERWNWPATLRRPD